MQKRPIFQFNVDTETGLDKIPNGSIISCLNSSGSVKQYQLVTKAGITSGTTIAQAITDNNLVVASGNTMDATTHAATSKVTPIDADEIPLLDSTTSFSLKKLTWANLKATLFGSPVFTGTPTAPTAAAGTNTEQLATTAFVQAFGDASAYDASHSFSNDGYQKLSNGFIIQWGIITCGNNGTQNFPITFPNACFGVHTQEYFSDIANARYPQFFTNSSVTMYWGDGDQRYIAIGY